MPLDAGHFESPPSRSEMRRHTEQPVGAEMHPERYGLMISATEEDVYAKLPQAGKAP